MTTLADILAPGIAQGQAAIDAANQATTAANKLATAEAANQQQANARADSLAQQLSTTQQALAAANALAAQLQQDKAALQQQNAALQQQLSAANQLAVQLKAQVAAAVHAPASEDIASGADAASAWNSAPDNAVITHSLLGTNTIGSTIHPAGKSVTINANGSTINCKASAGSGSNIVLQGNGFTLMHAIIGGDASLFRGWAANATFIDCHFLHSISSLLWDSSVGTGLNVIRCTFDQTDSVTAYVTADSASILDSNFAGSAGEYAIRGDISSDNGHKPVGLQIGRCNVTNHNAAGKDAIGLRMVDDAHVFDCQVSGDIRIGQTPATGAQLAPGTCNARTIIERTHFTNFPVGGAAIRIDQGAEVLARDVSFDCTPQRDCISIAAPSTLALAGNNQQLGTGPFKSLVTSSSTGTVTHA